jgi:hypothetical protein
VCASVINVKTCLVVLRFIFIPGALGSINIKPYSFALPCCLYRAFYATPLFKSSNLVIGI